MIWLVAGVVIVGFSVATMTNYRGFAEKYGRVTFSWWLGLPADHRWARRQVTLNRWSSVAGLFMGVLIAAHAFLK